VRGEEQGTKPPPSRLQAKLDASLLANENEADALLLTDPGPPVIVACGGRVSTTHPRVLVGPVFPAASVERTANMWAPSARWL
jgi:hypothetical protein